MWKRHAIVMSVPFIFRALCHADPPNYDNGSCGCPALSSPSAVSYHRYRWCFHCRPYTIWLVIPVVTAPAWLKVGFWMQTRIGGAIWNEVPSPNPEYVAQRTHIRCVVDHWHDRAASTTSPTKYKNQRKLVVWALLQTPGLPDMTSFPKSCRTAQ